MYPPVACWPDGAAVTFHYAEFGKVFYLKDPITGVVTPWDKVPRQGLRRITLWMGRHPLLEVSLDVDQQPIFVRLEHEDGKGAKAYLVGWKQFVGGNWIHSIGYYLPPTSSSVGRIVVAGEYQQKAIDQFSIPDFRPAPPPCWPDSTSVSFYYQDGSRVDRINRDNGAENTSDTLTRQGLRRIALWHHEMPVLECYYQPGQKAIFRRRNEYQDNQSAVIGLHGVPEAGIQASANWFAYKKAVLEHKYRAFYLLGWHQRIAERSVQSITYFYPQNGEQPPRVVLAGKFCETDESYLPIPVGKDNEVIT